VVEENDIGRNRSRRSGNFLELAFANQSGRIGTVPVLHEFAGDLRARAGGERAQLIERFFRTEVGGIGPPASSNAGRVIARCLSSWSNGDAGRFWRTATGAKFDTHQERPLGALRGIQHFLGLFSRTAPVAQSGVISPQANSFHPCVPEFGMGGSPIVATAAGFASPCAWAARAMTTVEIACLKINCS